MLSLLFAAPAFCLDNGLALTPPMGWMAWEQFRCEVDCKKNPKTCISENLFVDMIDRFHDDGWTKFGYEYICIDDCWMGKGRDANGEIYPDPERFPHGIKWLADYAHSKGVKLGIYNDYGTLTCGGYTGSEGYLVRDAKTFASWGVDMLKMDGCYSELLDMADGYPGMSYFLNSTGRPIVFLCSWPAYNQEMDYAPLPPHCNLWRNYGDITATWHAIKVISDKWGNNSHWADYAGPGHWNDPDMIVVGMKNGLTLDESKTQFALWAILAAPLLMSNDLRNIDSWAVEVVQNTEIIAVDQDKLGKQGRRVTAYEVDASVWMRELSDGAFAVALSNRGDTPIDITTTFRDYAPNNKYNLRDLYLHKDLGAFTDTYTAKSVPPHGVVMLKLTPA